MKPRPLNDKPRSIQAGTLPARFQHLLAALFALAALFLLLPYQAARADVGNKIAAGSSHTCAVADTGFVQCWGSNKYGKLGNGTTTNTVAPVSVFTLSGVQSVAVSYIHSCALTEAGEVKCWGSNTHGKLGDGTTTNRLEPVSVIDSNQEPLSGVAAITVGAAHSCALTVGGEVKCWGDNSKGQLGDGGATSSSSVPVSVANLNGVNAIAAGKYHTCALTASGEVKCWGNNSEGQLGNNTNDNQNTPVSVVINSSGEALSGVTAIAVNNEHTCALSDTEQVKCWGNNSHGQLGDGTTTARLMPVSVSELSGVSAIAAGHTHTCALTEAGEAKCWGGGPLGDGATGNQNTPVSVLDLSGVTAIAAGSFYTCAVTVGGNVKCWGQNDYGELGDGTTKNSLIPVDANGGKPHKIATGDYHSCALTKARTVQCWGYNSSGQLGDGTTEKRLAPVDVSGLSGVKAIAAGYYHTCALAEGGTVKCWGGNSGRLGDGTTNKRLVPVSVIDSNGEPLSGIVAIAAGKFHTCAVTTGGEAKCWGRNDYAQLGDGTKTARLKPVLVTGLSGVTAIAAGGDHTCALTDAGKAKCWGYNSSGQLGDGGATNSSVAPVDVSSLSGVKAITAGEYHTCALTTSGEGKCWGDGGSGRLGNNSNGNQNAPVSVSGLSEVTEIAAGRKHTCAMTVGGNVKCWGSNGQPDNREGRLGEGTTKLSRIPIAANGGKTNHRVAAGDQHSCALTAAGKVQCWGRNNNGQLGDGSTTERHTPVFVPDLSKIRSVVAGESHTCILTYDRNVQCWGDNYRSQLGDGNAPTDTSVPVSVIDSNGESLSGVTAIAAGSYHTCVLIGAGEVKCWGRNGLGQLGDNTTTERSVAVNVIDSNGEPLSMVTAIAAGGSYTCAVTDTGGVKCWGLNNKGQLGDGTTSNRPTAVDVPDLDGVTAIVAGYGHTCVLTETGEVKCWGYNKYGQLGNDNKPTDSLLPVSVSGLNGVEVTAITAGHNRTCALIGTGEAMCWGSNADGQLGDGTTTNRAVPVSVSGLSGVMAIAANTYHTCALTETWGVKCWGDNSYGRLGDGTTENRLTPVDVNPPIAADVSIGGTLMTAQTLSGSYTYSDPESDPESGSSYRWRHADDNTGANAADIGSADSYTVTTADVGRYLSFCVTPSDGSSVGSETCSAWSGPVDNATDNIATLTTHTCALGAVGEVKCWGNNSYGQLGDGSTVNRSTPVSVIDPSSGQPLNGMKALAAGYRHTCALGETGEVKCWGSNFAGQLGDNSGTEQHSPVPVSNLSGVTTIAAGHSHTCALTDGGEVWCWGRNNYGQLGNGTTADSLVPVRVSNLSGVTAIGVGIVHNCALLDTGEVWCWGRNNYSQLGNGGTGQENTPVIASGLSGVLALAAGTSHTCALLDSGNVECWGRNIVGQLGNGSGTDSTTPVSVSNLSAVNVTAIAAGKDHTCALISDGTVQCWGSNGNGQLGNNTTDNQVTPVSVSNLSGATALAGSYTHTCVLLDSGGAKCWGKNDVGQLGNGTTSTTDSLVPVDVVMQ